MPGYGSGVVAIVRVIVQISVRLGTQEGAKEDKKKVVMAQRRQLLTQAQTAVDLHFGPFRVEGTQRLWQGDRLMAVRPRPLTVLRYLAERPGQIITSKEMLKRIWPDIYVTKTVLRVCVRELRQALEEDPVSHSLSRRWADRGIASSPRSRLPSQKSIVSTQSPVAHRRTLPLNNCELRTGNGQLILWAASGNWLGCVSYSNVCDEASARRCSSSASPGSARPPWSIACLIKYGETDRCGLAAGNVLNTMGRAKPIYRCWRR